MHYISNGILIERILAVRHFENAHTGDNIYTMLKLILREFDVDLSDSVNIMFVTDRGSNIIKALQNNIRISCMDHILHNILEKSTEECIEIKKCVEACKKLVKFFKKSTISNGLKKTLKSACPTRWTSVFDMCSSIHKSMNDVIALLQERNELIRLQEINTQLLSEMVEFLTDFNIVFLKLQSSKKITSHLIFLYYNNLKKRCDVKHNDSEAIKSLKRKVQFHLREIYLPEIRIIHKAATFLFPPCKHMQLLAADEKTDIYNFIKSIINNTTAGTEDTEDHSSTTGNLTDEVGDEDNEESELDCTRDFSFPASLNTPVDDELKDYLNSQSPVCTDLLKWWDQNQKTYPNLYMAHLVVHSIPATSAASERAFSAAGNIITQKRTRLDSLNVNNLIVANSNPKINQSLSSLVEDLQ